MKMLLNNLQTAEKNFKTLQKRFANYEKKILLLEGKLYMIESFLAGIGGIKHDKKHVYKSKHKKNTIAH